MDDVFARILNLTSYRSSRLIDFIEEILYGFVNGCHGGPIGFNPCRDSSSQVSATSWKTSSECSSSSLEHTEAVDCPGICPVRYLAVKDFPTCTGTFPTVRQNYGCLQNFRGLVLPSFCFGAICQIALHYWRCLVDYAQWLKVGVVRLIS